MTKKKALPIFLILGLILGLTGCADTNFIVGGFYGEIWSTNISGAQVGFIGIGIVVIVAAILVIIR